MTDRSRFALIGHPVAHSMSPAIHGAMFRALGLPHTYELIDVPSADALGPVLDAIRRGDIEGANVTVPYKRAVLALVDAVDPSAQAVSAANVIVRGGASSLVAHNTDARALQIELEIALGDRPRARAAILGAGGAALAAIVASSALGFAEVGVTTRSWSSRSALAASPRAPSVMALGARLALYPSAEPPGAPPPFAGRPPILDWMSWIEGADLVVQATSAGMSGVPDEEINSTVMAVPPSRLKRGVLVYDVVYNPPVTPLLRAVRAAGIEATGGLGMLIRQAALSFTLWTGAPAPLDAIRL